MVQLRDLGTGVAGLQERWVEAAFYAEDTFYAVDLGVIGFTDGWLHFEGIHSTFSFNRGHVDRVSHLMDKPDFSGIPIEYHYRILYSLDGRRYLVAIRLVDNREEEAMDKDVDHWRRGLSDPTVSASYPPTVPLQGGLKAHLARMRGIALNLCFGLSAIVMFAMKVPAITELACLAVIIGAFVSLKRWRAEEKHFRRLVSMLS